MESEKKQGHHEHHGDHEKHDVKHMNKHHGEKKIHHVKENKFTMNIWQVATGILALLLIVSFSTNGFNFSSGDSVKENTLNFINTQLLQGQGAAEITEFADKGGVYEFNLKVQGRDIKAYTTKDGKLLFTNAINMEEGVEAPAAAPVAEVTTKLDKPEVELFVMSHCPYGTQAEKGALPVALLLGDKIDFKIKFVHYAMHGEVEVNEQLNQHCIQEEQNDKFLPYLKCFLEAGDGDGCLDSTQIDKTTLKVCTDREDEKFSVTSNLEDTASYLSGRFPMFDVHKAESQKYGVKGSPTLVINGEQVQSGRDSISYLGAICSGFNEQPEECNTELEAGAPGPGFGWDKTGSANVASCGG